MNAITYTQPGDASVLELVERPLPEPGEGELRIRVIVSGVNPTDWKSRSGRFGVEASEPTVPNHDGAGVVDKLGVGVTELNIGDRVWVPLAGHDRPTGSVAMSASERTGRRSIWAPTIDS